MSTGAAPSDGEVAGGGARSRKGAQTRARLLDAAKQIFEENGFLDARISDIAERAAVSHGSFYHYFDSKEQIFHEVVEDLEQRLSDPMYDVVFRAAPGTTARERLFTAIHRHFERYREEARIMGVIEQASRYDAHVAGMRVARRQQYRDDVATSIRHLQRRGMADPSLDPAIAAAALGAMTERFTEALLVERSVDCTIEEAASTLTALYVNTLQMGDAADAPPRGRVARAE
jgi:AcrR family transcriptional regulator